MVVVLMTSKTNIETKLILWDEMKTAVINCHSVDEVAQIRNRAEAYRYALKQAKESPEVIRKAEEIKLRAERRAGELLMDTPKNKGGQYRSQAVTGTLTLENIGVTKNQSSKWQKIASIPEDKFETYLSVQKELSTSGAISLAKNIEREKKSEETVTPKIEGKYRVIYADPPWKYDADFMDKYGHAKSHYATMDMDELCALPIKEIAMPDSVLFMWVTSPKLHWAFPIMNAWGFEYKTSFVWDKIKHNFGHYNSVRHEFLLIGGRGSSTPDSRELHDSVISIERLKHSEKPQYFRNLIDILYTSGDRIELFARRKAENSVISPNIFWDSWGSEVDEQ